MKNVSAFVLCALLVFITAFTPIVACKKTRETEEFPITTKKQKTILSLWEIDTFEGGFGSRADYLSNLLEKFIEDGVFVMVTSYSLEGAKKKAEEGVFPDLVSFGIGADFIAEGAKELKKIDFSGGENAGGIYAYPWCSGGYFLISKNPINKHIDRLIVSKGEFNNPLVALYNSDFTAEEVVVRDTATAYSEYIGGGGVLLGTQRDIRRLSVKNVAFTATALEEFCDLFQYVAVTAFDEEKFSYAKEVAEYIYENAGANISKIGMLPVGENSQEGALSVYDRSKTKYTVSPFTSANLLSLLHLKMSDGTSEEKSEILENTLKHL